MPITKKRLLLLSLLVLCARAAAQETTTPPASGVFGGPPPEELKWETFGSGGDEFHVRFPAEPTVFDTYRSVKGSAAREGARVYEAYDDGVAFLIVVYDKPRAGETFDYFFDDLRSRFLKGWDASFENDVSLDSTSGKHYKLAREGARGGACFFLRRKHAYMIAAVGRDPRERVLEGFLYSLTMWLYPLEKMRGDDSPTQGAITPQRTADPPPGYQPPDYSDRSKYLLPGIKVITSAATAQAPARGGDAGGAPAGAAQMPAPKIEYQLDAGEGDGVTQDALVVLLPEPNYEADVLRNRPTRAVKLKGLLRADGKVEGVAVVEAPPDELGERAAQALRRAVFLPAQKDGRAVSQRITVEYKFDVD